MTNINAFRIPTPADDELKFEDMPFSAYQYNVDKPDGALVDKEKVKNATTEYKQRKIGRSALFEVTDKFAA